MAPEQFECCSEWMNCIVWVFIVSEIFSDNKNPNTITTAAAIQIFRGRDRKHRPRQMALPQ